MRTAFILQVIPELVYKEAGKAGIEQKGKNCKLQERPQLILPVMLNLGIALQNGPPSRQWGGAALCSFIVAALPLTSVGHDLGKRKLF